MTNVECGIRTVGASRWNALIEDGEKYLTNYFKSLEKIEEHNFNKVLSVLIKNKICEQDFSWVTGYGHDDVGRQKLDKIFSEIFNTEAALVRPHFVSGTHAISCCFFGCLRPHDELVSITGEPYDTLYSVIGIGGRDDQPVAPTGSLIDFGITYKEIPLVREGFFAGGEPTFGGKPALTDFDAIPKYISRNTKMVFIQRSKGYQWRKSLTNSEIEKIILQVKKIDKKIICFVDNCFGEFTEILEPTNVGADLTCGSLVKNIGGGIVPAGGYIAGRKDLVQMSSERLTAPGIEGKGGCMFDLTRIILQGLFFAPHIVTQVLKGISLSSYFFKKLGFKVNPEPTELKTDIVLAIKLDDKSILEKICKVVQSNSPVNSHLIPIPSKLPGYVDEVIMGGGTFIEGSTIELSCDAPMREPYILYWQGGLNYFHTKTVLKEILAVF